MLKIVYIEILLNFGNCFHFTISIFEISFRNFVPSILSSLQCFSIKRPIRFSQSPEPLIKLKNRNEPEPLQYILSWNSHRVSRDESEQNMYNRSISFKVLFIESHLIYKWCYYRQIIFNQSNIMVPYIDTIGLYQSVEILWEVYVMRHKCHVSWLRFNFKRMLIAVLGQ